MPITGSGSGSGGSPGRGIVSVTRTNGTGSPGTTDTYTITYTDSTTSTFQVYNGADGPQGPPGAGGSGSSGITYSKPLHPLAYRVAGTRAADLSPANIGGLVGISSGTDTGSNTHRLVTFPYDVGRVGIVVGNFYVNDPSTARDTISGLSPVVVTAAIGDTGASSQPVPGFGLSYFSVASGQGKMLSGDDPSVTVQPGDAAVIDFGMGAAAGSQKFINVFADVTASGAGAKFPVMGTVPNSTDRATTSAGETDKTLSLPSALANNAGHGFDFLAVVDLTKLAAGTPWQACLIVGDSLNGGAYGTQQALQSSPVPFAQIARGQEQLQEFLQFGTGKSTYRRSISGQMLASFAYVQYLTNDANLSDGQTLGPGAATAEGIAWKRSWQVKQRDLVRWLKRRGIDRVAWATVPPNTASNDTWATLAGQGLEMSGRGGRQQLMQDWNNFLRSGTLLYADPAGWKLYAAPSGQGFAAGSVVADIWAPLTVMQTVNTSVVHLGDATTGPVPSTFTSGYDFGGQPIMKWAIPGGVAATTDGLHPGTTAGTNIQAAGVSGVLNYMAVNG